jgi:hypothetical protein
MKKVSTAATKAEQEFLTIQLDDRCGPGRSLQLLQRSG